eukprot:8132543-Alexandrium_andersonii.AAC.1
MRRSPCPLASPNGSGLPPNAQECGSPQKLVGAWFATESSGAWFTTEAHWSVVCHRMLGSVVHDRSSAHWSVSHEFATGLRWSALRADAESRDASAGPCLWPGGATRRREHPKCGRSAWACSCALMQSVR